MDPRKFRRRLLTGVAFAGALSTQAMAAQATLIEINSANRPLSEALRVVGQQAGLNLLVDSGLVAGRQAPAVRGRMTSDEALSRLLQGSGLVVRRIDGGSAYIQRASMAIP